MGSKSLNGSSVVIRIPLHSRKIRDFGSKTQILGGSEWTFDSPRLSQRHIKSSRLARERTGASVLGQVEGSEAADLELKLLNRAIHEIARTHMTPGPHVVTYETASQQRVSTLPSSIDLASLR